MHNFECGFLSEPFEDIRNQVREIYPSWHSLLHQINCESVETQHTISIHPENDQEVYAAALFARTISSTQAAVILLEHGLVSQARCVLRSGLETLFALGAISEKPEIVERITEWHKYEQQRTVKNMRNWKHPDLKRIAEMELAKDSVQELLNPEASSISTFDLAQAAGLEDWYRSIYMTFSWSTHSAPIDLERHLVKDQNGNLMEFKNEPEINEQEVSWLVAIDTQIKATYALSRIFKSINTSSTQAHEENLHSLAQTLSN